MWQQIDRAIKTGIVVVGALLLLGLGLAVVQTAGQVRQAARPSFTYLAEAGNGQLLQPVVCAGDQAITYRVAGYNEGTAEAGLSIVHMQSRHQETGAVYRGRTFTSISGGSEPGPFSREFTAEFERPLVAGNYTHAHGFFNVRERSGATTYRGFAFEYEVVDCSER